MIKERIYLKNGESKLIKLFSMKHLVLIMSHYSKKLNLDVTICFPTIQKGCQFCKDYGKDMSFFGRELQRRQNLLFIVGDNDTGKPKLLFTQNEDNDIELLSSFKKYSDKFDTHFLKLTRKKDYYFVKPIHHMTSIRKSEFERFRHLKPTAEFVADCTIILDAEQISQLIKDLRKEYFSKRYLSTGK